MGIGEKFHLQDGNGCGLRVLGREEDGLTRAWDRVDEGKEPGNAGK
jgi:hypothetical protein